MLGLWWALWLASLLLDRIVANMWDNAITAEALRTVGVVELLGAVVTLGAAATVILIVRQINAWQDGRTVQAGWTLALAGFEPAVC